MKKGQFTNINITWRPVYLKPVKTTGAEIFNLTPSYTTSLGIIGMAAGTIDIFFISDKFNLFDWVKQVVWLYDTIYIS